MAVLVTGGAGYIGSHVVLALLDEGRDVVVLDDLSTGFAALVDPRAHLVVGDVGDQGLIEETCQTHDVDAVMHFAAHISVPESTHDPLKYYFNNLAKTVNLVRTGVDLGIRHWVFSSTAAVYGEPERLPITEAAPLCPINPYGRAKKMVEDMLRDLSEVDDISYVSLRYFNVAGADPDMRSGQSNPEAGHLIKVAVRAALGLHPQLQIFGDDYDTPDGTCVRDYVHVCDLADIHRLALDHLRERDSSLILNAGYGRGFSVRDVLDTVAAVSGVDLAPTVAPRRPGDPARLVADSQRLGDHFKWEPTYDDLSTIVAHALKWEERLQQSPLSTSSCNDGVDSA